MNPFLNNRMTGRWGRTAWPIATVGLLLIVQGCASGRNGPLMTWRVNDPPQLSPYSRSLSQPGSNSGTYRAGRPAFGGQFNDIDPNAPLTTIPPRQSNSPPGSNPTPAENGSEQGPLLGELSAPPPAGSTQAPPNAVGDLSVVRGEPLDVTVIGPSDAKLREEVTFQVTVRNADREALEEVVVLCSLPEGMVLPGAPQRAFRQRIGRLEPQQEQTLDLSLRCDDVGRHCVTFEVTAEGVDAISKSACVECQSETVSLELTGPSERTADSRAEFVLTLRNLTGVEQPDVHVVLRHEGVLDPREASAGVIRQPGQLEWDLGVLRIDERVQIQVEFVCLSVAEQTCLAASVTGRHLDTPPIEACLRITPAAALDLNVVDQQDPVMVGEKVTYVVRVTNTGLLPLSDLTVQLQADGLQPVGLTLGDHESPSGAEFDRSSGVVIIPLPGTLAPDATNTITLQTRATRAGQGRLQAVVTQSNASLQVTTTEPTVINRLPGSVALDDR